MKWLRTLILFDKGGITKSDDWKAVHESYVRSITSVDFPQGSGKLILRRKVKRADGQWQRNGVKYLKNSFFENLTNAEGWKPEASVDLNQGRSEDSIRLYPSNEKHQEPIASNFGGFDFVTDTPNRLRVAIEWETGNISSSHRSMNKLAITLQNQVSLPPNSGPGAKLKRASGGRRLWERQDDVNSHLNTRRKLLSA